MITNLTTKQIESIQIDEGVIFLNYGESDERLLAPTRGGGEFAATVTVRDIEFDGRHGKAVCFYGLPNDCFSGQVFC